MTDGIYKTQQEIDNNTLKYSGNVVPDIGSARYKDISGKLDADGNYTAPDGFIRSKRPGCIRQSPSKIYLWMEQYTYFRKFIEISAFFREFTVTKY
jgi:hypothetical protein